MIKSSECHPWWLCLFNLKKQLKISLGIMLLVIHCHAAQNQWNEERFINHFLTSLSQGSLLVWGKIIALCPRKVYICYQQQDFCVRGQPLVRFNMWSSAEGEKTRSVKGRREHDSGHDDFYLLTHWSRLVLLQAVTVTALRKSGTIFKSR